MSIDMDKPLGIVGAMMAIIIPIAAVVIGVLVHVARDTTRQVPIWIAQIKAGEEPR